MTTPWILPSPNTIEPLLALLPFRPPLLSPSLHAASIKLRLLPAASLLPMVEPPVAASIPATLSASAPLHRPTVGLLASRPPLFSSQGVHFCSSSLNLPSFFGWLLRPVGLMGGGGGGGGVVLLFLLLLFTCSRSTSQPLLGCVALLSATFPSPPSCPSPPSLSSAEPRLSQ